jgi:hypothetical protein
MNREVMRKYNTMTVAEGAGSTLADAHGCWTGKKCWFC